MLNIKIIVILSYMKIIIVDYSYVGSYQTLNNKYIKE
jgi:hypothetical protein